MGIAAAIALAPAGASANVEIGGTAGIHVFSSTNELGVPDIQDAPSERNSALFGVRIGFMFNDYFGIEGEFGVIPSEARSMVFDVWNITYRAHLIAQLRAANPNNKLIPFLLFGGGAMTIVSTGNPDIIGKDTDAELYAGIGAKYRVEHGWGLRADGRILFPPSSASKGATVDFEALLSIYYEFGRKAPEPPKPVVKDSDGDGILDTVDKCPTQPEDKDGFQDADGCPDPDNDGDGIPDTQDKCPNEAEDKDGFQDADGCPDPDNDNDGVPDTQDKCPNEPETKNGYQDEDGCPDDLPKQVKQFTGVIQGINFRTNSSDLLANSDRMLDKAVAVLKEFPDLKLEIQGHTDDQAVRKGGKFADNEALSQARAESVKAYLVKKGIDPDRLIAKGYGSSAPLVDPTGLKHGALNAARAKNRRVEFKLLSNLVQPGAETPNTPPAPVAPTVPPPSSTTAPGSPAPAPPAPAASASPAAATPPAPAAGAAAPAAGAAAPETK